MALAVDRSSYIARCKNDSLVGFITDVPPVVVEFGQLGGVQLTERGTRGCHQPSVVNANTDVSGTTKCQPTREQRTPIVHNLLSSFGVTMRLFS